MLTFKKRVAKTARHYSDYFHNEFMEAYNHDYRTGHYRDLLSEVIDIMDMLEAKANKKWWKK